MMESGDSVRPVGVLIRFSAPRLIGATVTPLNARLVDFPIHFAAQIGGNAAQLHVQPVAGAAAGQAEDKFNPRLFQRMMLSDDAAAMPLQNAAIDLGAPVGAIPRYAFHPDAVGRSGVEDIDQGGGEQRDDHRKMQQAQAAVSPTRVTMISRT